MDLSIQSEGRTMERTEMFTVQFMDHELKPIGTVKLPSVPREGEQVCFGAYDGALTVRLVMWRYDEHVGGRFARVFLR